MEIIPAIDLLGGKCVRLYQGNYDQVEPFSDDPVQVARQWVEQGATRLHLVDLDGAKMGEPVNLPAIAAILESLRAAPTPIHVQVGGGLRTRERIQTLLDLGVQSVIVGTIAAENPTLVAELCQIFPQRIIVGIDARNGQVAIRGWLETSTLTATALATQMAAIGAAAIIYTDIQRDGTLQGPNLPALREMVEHCPIPVIASGGISSVTDLLSLLSLEAIGLTGAIVGRALYTGAINLREALQAAGPARIQDIPPDFGQSSWA
ncbi:1-(5-phosphoribosyl)-5-[(5-phosphoribosylamino)methylideneamino]imidazole-4-carboxamide isomerase [Trichothermofontia sichuanensis B231]|nr:1-(5-phosphoribosyl)-5-[(5-phosphoribosylamino)methylideneamino]imidazole-4-carboxamide isomerase [Trichothermofontia sichuanensis]UZQ56337.1 1-(5-phosphoribosyl)-5-[(5-phosphoribosylamino)methylideneamino]imidazole-4-carboxamide isomerase [Trichothermofontia sichuanensis B231]